MNQALIKVLSYLYRTSQSYIFLDLGLHYTSTPTIPPLEYCQPFLLHIDIKDFGDPLALASLQDLINESYGQKPAILKAFFNDIDSSLSTQRFNYYEFCYFLEKENISSKCEIDTYMRILSEKDKLFNSVPVKFPPKAPPHKI